MKSPFVRTAIVVAVAAGLLAYSYFVESKRVEKPEKAKEKVLAFDKTKVKELTLTPAGGAAVHLTKDKDGWHMTAPLAVAADSTEADALVSSLESLEMDEVVAEAPTKLADYGLEAPRNTVGVLVQGAGKPLELLFGEKSPDGNSVYAKLPTRPRVFTIPGYLESSFGKKPFDLRDRDLMHVKRDAVKTVDVHGPEGDYALARDDKGEWAFTEPLATRAGRWSLDGLLGIIESLKMESVAAEEAKDLKPFGLLKPERTVTLGLADGKTKRLEIGGSPAQDKFHAREASTSLVAVIPNPVVNELKKGMKDLRAKRLLDIATYEVEGFEAEVEGAKRSYARATLKDKQGADSYKWKRTAPGAKDLDTGKVQDFLFKVGGVEVQEFVDAPASLDKYGLDKPTFKMTMRFAAGKTPVWFELGKKDGAVYARRADDAAVLKLDFAKADDLVKSLKEL